MAGVSSCFPFEVISITSLMKLEPFNSIYLGIRLGLQLSPKSVRRLWARSFPLNPSSALKTLHGKGAEHSPFMRVAGYRTKLLVCPSSGAVPYPVGLLRRQSTKGNRKVGGTGGAPVQVLYPGYCLAVQAAADTSAGLGRGVFDRLS